MQMKCSNYTVCNYEDSKRGLSKISAPSSESDDMRAAFGSKDEWFQNGKVPLHHVGIDGFSWTMAIAGGVSTSSVESNVAMFRRIYFAMFRLFLALVQLSCNILTLDIAANTLAGTGSLAASTTALLAIYRSRTM